MLDHTRKLLTNIYGSVGFARLGAIHLDEYSLEGLQKKKQCIRRQQDMTNLKGFEVVIFASVCICNDDICKVYENPPGNRSAIGS